MDKKLFRNIIAAVCASAALGAACLAAFMWEPPADTGEAADDAAELTLFELDKEIESVGVKNTSGSFNIILSNGGYTIENAADKKLDAQLLNDAVNSLHRIPAKQKMDENKDLGEFGLDEPQAVVTAFAGGSEHRILIGDKAPVGDGYYMTSDGGGVYLVASAYAKYYLLSVNDYRDKSIAYIDMSALERLEIYKDGDTVVSIRKNDGAERSELMDTSLIMEYPYKELVSASRLLDALGESIAVTAEKFADGTDEQYGIGKYTVKISASGASYTILFGNEDGSGNVYAKYAESGDVFTVKPELYNAVSGFEPFDYIYKFAHIFLIDDAAEVSFEAGGEKYILSCKDGVYFINSEEVSYETYKNAYSSIIGVMITSEADASKCGKRIGGAVFKLKDGTEKTIEYFEYDERNYAVKRDGGTAFCILKKNIDAVPQQIESLLTGY